MVNTFLKWCIFLVVVFSAAVAEVSFVTRFNIFGAVPNLVFMVFFLALFLSGKNNYQWHFFIAVTAGVFLDVIGSRYFGISSVALLILYGVNLAIWRFFQQTQGQHQIFYFAGLFFGSLLLYDGLLYLASIIFSFSFELGLQTFIGLCYSLIVACAAFFLYQKFLGKDFDKNQLKLF